LLRLDGNGRVVEAERSEELERVVEDEDEEVVEFVKACEAVEEEEGEEGLLNRTRTNDVASTQKKASKSFLKSNLL